MPNGDNGEAASCRTFYKRMHNAWGVELSYNFFIDGHSSFEHETWRSNENSGFEFDSPTK